MPIQINNLTPEEIDGLDLTIENWVVTQASISTLLPDPQWINLVCFGDSNTEGIEMPTEDSFCYMLNQNPDIIAFNEWVAWETSSQLLSRIQTSVLDKKDINKRNIVTLLVWTNDTWYMTPATTIWTNIQNIISQLQSDNWEVILMTYPVRNDTQRDPIIRELNTLIRDNISTLWCHFIDLHDLFVNPSNPNLNRNEIARTQLHFNGNWHRVINDTVQSILGYESFVSDVEVETEINNTLTTWGYTGLSYNKISGDKGILLGKLNNMFKLGIIDYPVAAAWGAFGGNTSLQTDITHAWDFESNADDLVGSNNWTVTWAINWAYGKYGNAYRFSNTSDRISITTLSSSVKSISVWAKKSSTWAWGRVMGSSGSTYYLFQLYNDGNNYCRILSWQTLSWAQTDDTNYHHYVITADGTTVKIYVDWVLKLSQSSTWDFSNFDLIWNYGSSYSTATAWKWDIDEVYTWDKVLNSTDVSDLYASWAWLFYNS